MRKAVDTYFMFWFHCDSRLHVVDILACSIKIACTGQRVTTANPQTVFNYEAITLAFLYIAEVDFSIL